MEDTDGPSRNATQTSLNDNLAPGEDEHYYEALNTHIQIFQPFLTKLINNSEQLNILPEHVSMFQSLYAILDDKRLSLDRLKNIQSILYKLYKVYRNPLKFNLPPDFKTSLMQGTELTNREKQVSSDERYTYNKINQNQNSESEPSNNIQVPEETRISTEQAEIKYSKYTLKGKSKKCVLAGLICEEINSILLFKCSVSNCLENKFSTIIELYNHTIKNHKYVIRNGNCEACHPKRQLVSEPYYVRNALEHLLSHHLVLRNTEKHPNAIINLEGSNIDNVSPLCQDTVKNTTTIECSLKFRYLPGDKLSIHFTENNMRENSEQNTLLGNQCQASADFMENNMRENSEQNTLLGNQCQASADFTENNMRENSEQNTLLGNQCQASADFMENNMRENAEQNSLLGNQCQASAVDLNINNSSNDKSYPLLNSRISDVNRLKKRKVKSSEKNSNASGVDDLNMRMKAKTNCEVVLPNLELFLEAGQQIVNNVLSADSTICCLINTAYTKNYIGKVREFPMNKIKTRLAFNKMSALPTLLDLFKCMDRNCTQSFSSKELFKCHLAIHFSNAEKKKKNQIHNVQYFKMCAYCFKMFEDEESLANHIAGKYTFCEYFCPHCFYRAYTASHVLVHQSVVHTNISKHCIIKPNYDDSVFKYSKEMLLVVDFKGFVLPYKCNIGCCDFSCYLQNKFVEHLNQKHQQCSKFCCYICADKHNDQGFFALHPSIMIIHFKLHNLNKYQCIFCLFGCEVVDSMIMHLALEHFEYEALCLERSTVSDDCESNNIRNLKILRLNKVINDGIIEIVNLPSETIYEPLQQQSNKRSIKSSDVLSIAMKSACIEEEFQSSSNTLHDSVQMVESNTSKSLDIDNEFIMIDDDDVNQNDNDESLEIITVWSGSNNKEKKSQVSSNDDIIVIDNENNINIPEEEELNKSPTEQICLKDRSNKVNIIELDNLFTCKECEKVFSNGEIYFDHLKNVCPFWNFTAGKKCLYCDKTFRSPYFMTEHIKLHGPDRFNCYLCNLNVPSQRAITNHMKNYHKIKNIDFFPENPSLTDFNKDNYIVLENKKVKLNKQKLTCNKCSFEGNTREIIISHMKVIHDDEQYVDCEDNLCKIPQEQPDDTNNSFNSLIFQQNGQQSPRLKRKHSTIIDKEEFHQQSKHLYGTDNIPEQQTLESIEPTLESLNCLGAPIESTPLKPYIKSCGVPKSPKLETKISLIPSIKQTISKGSLNNFGEISSDGQFVCPLCYVFKTINLNLFRGHLYKEINYKNNMWMCLTCFKISNSMNTIAWHVQKHGNGNNYEKLKDNYKFKWVNLVIGHQHNMLSTGLKKNE